MAYAESEDANTPEQILQGGSSFDEDFEEWGENSERTGWQKAIVVVAGIGVVVAFVGVIVSLACLPHCQLGYVIWNWISSCSFGISFRRI